MGNKYNDLANVLPFKLEYCEKDLLLLGRWSFIGLGRPVQVV